MQINNELIVQWEPKVQKMASSVIINGLDRDDLAQELRLAICKAAAKYDDTRQVKFHTYLHTSMVNTIRTLLFKATQKSKRNFYVVPLEAENQNGFDLKDRIEEKISVLEDFTTIHNLESIDFTRTELAFINLRLMGYTNAEISKKLQLSMPHKIAAKVKEKMNTYYGEKVSV